MDENTTNISGESQGKKHSLNKRIIVLSAVIIVSTLLVIYLGIAYFFDSHFLPNTRVNNLDFSCKTVEEMVRELEINVSENYVLEIIGRDETVLTKVEAKAIELEVSEQGGVQLLKEQQNPMKWFLSLFNMNQQSQEFICSIRFNQKKLEETLETAGIFNVKDAIRPENAYIGSYDMKTTQYELISEKEGNLLNKAMTLKRVEEAIANQENRLNLEESLCYVAPEITTQNKELQKTLSLLNTMVSTCITYDWNGEIEILDGDIIHEWIILEDDKVILDEEAVSSYIAEKSKKNDTYGKKRTFFTTLGIELTLPSGAYGWRTNKKEETEILIQLIKEGTVTECEPEYAQVAYVKGYDDIGKSYVEIDLSNQHLYLYVEGEIILETDFVSGNMANGNSTPQGVFGITYKTRNAVLRGADYETPVNYWMPFNGNIGMHDATWRRSFGGEIYLTKGSHGCVNLPLKKAEEIYSYMEEKFPVICYYYD